MSARTNAAITALCLPAGVSIWSGWVELGKLCGFGVVHPFPGTPLDDWSLNTSVTLPIGVEAYAAFALHAWLKLDKGARGRSFAGASAVASLLLGCAGQAAYHLMAASGMTAAPWQITMTVSMIPVIMLGLGTVLGHVIDGRKAPAQDPSGPAQGPAPEGQPPAQPPVQDPQPPAQPSTRERVRALRAQHPNMTAAAIGREVGVSRQTVAAHLTALAAMEAAR